MDNLASGPFGDAVLTLRAFMAAMNEWELAADSAVRTSRAQGAPIEDVTAHFAMQLIDIFAQYCEEGRPARSVTFRRPPEYDAEAEKILEVIALADDGVRILTQQTTGFKKKIWYTLSIRDGQWRIGRRSFIDYNGEEVEISL